MRAGATSGLMPRLPLAPVLAPLRSSLRLTSGLMPRLPLAPVLAPLRSSLRLTSGLLRHSRLFDVEAGCPPYRLGGRAGLPSEFTLRLAVVGGRHDVQKPDPGGVQREIAPQHSARSTDRPSERVHQPEGYTEPRRFRTDRARGCPEHVPHWHEALGDD